ncbi:tyrosine-type recombinase/integrase [Candidatus Bathyarchaeota archaeon]|nr:tyrosine-type recombinase/integrase [Candidatus Bathyarchaeota archaeon]
MGAYDGMEVWRETLRQKSANTRKEYEYQFARFLQWANMTAQEFRESLKQQWKLREKADDPLDVRTVEMKVVAYMNYLKNKSVENAPERKISENTMALARNAITSFCRANGLALEFKRSDFPKPHGSEARMPKANEIKQWLLNAKSQPYHAAVLVLKDSGLRQSDVVNLRWSQIHDYGKEDLSNEGFWGFGKIKTEKEGTMAVPFVGPEASEALKVLQNEKEDDLIFHFDAKLLSTNISRIVDRAKGEGVSGHSLRRFFQTKMENAGLPANWIDRMTGHKLPDNQRAYSLPSEEELFKKYREAYDSLRVLGADIKQVEKLNMTMEELKKDNADLREEYSRLKIWVDFQIKMGEEINSRLHMGEEYKKLVQETLKDIPLETVLSDSIKKALTSITKEPPTPNLSEEELSRLERTRMARIKKEIQS